MNWPFGLYISAQELMKYVYKRITHAPQFSDPVCREFEFIPLVDQYMIQSVCTADFSIWRCLMKMVEI